MIRILSHWGQEAERIIGIIKNDVYNDFETVGTSDASFTDADISYVRTMAEPCWS